LLRVARVVAVLIHLLAQAVVVAVLAGLGRVLGLQFQQAPHIS
jgi:hypothetical protein